MLAVLLSTFCERRFRLALKDLTTWSEFSFRALSKNSGVMTGMVEVDSVAADVATGAAVAPGREVSMGVLSLADWTGVGGFGVLTGAGPADMDASIEVSLGCVSVDCGVLCILL